ncbi:hypothetical protein POSPLADRAFT_1053735 [Postia placenta MAD-698-R-SB12]|uniref:Histone H1 n=1 Tax=Postia placenta MAD-698-R-SB12 TaxID=670580 RepID=A0A1X6N8U7_9APHY|nr:hypothetical protein POSPLADRAFT_1053735 [Postia placenta MAD-698-R-SB12]OSX64932.1 hypothetical protein POSPLADRAFT_1053735 [Postia placenta MAD-698-R-SB12]
MVSAKSTKPASTKAKTPKSTTSKANAKPIASHPSWKEMITECIVNHKEEARSGVSRATIKKYISEKYKLDIEGANASQLNRALTHGAEKGVFAFPKGPSGKVKLAPKNKPTPANENVQPAPAKEPATIKKAAAKAPAKAPTKASSKTTVKSSAKAAAAPLKKTPRASAPAKKSASKAAPAPAKKSTRPAPTTKKTSSAKAENKKAAVKAAATKAKAKSAAKPRSRSRKTPVV